MQDSKRISFDELGTSDLFVDAIYEGGTEPDLSSDALHIIFPKCGNSGGFRKVMRNDDKKKTAYVILYTSMEEIEWPDYLDVETGIFRYYGDNRKPGRQLTNTHHKGNLLLEQVFTMLNAHENLSDIPPFFVFKKASNLPGHRRDIQFLGLAVPGNPKISPDRDLVAFWRTIGDKRFQNYEAYFTILDTGDKPISREWLSQLIENHNASLDYAPQAWRNFIEKGREGIIPLKAPKVNTIPSKNDQLNCDEEGRNCVISIYEHYNKFPQGFENCATRIAEMMDNNFQDFNLTRPWRDGGRDAIGYYAIHQGGMANRPLLIDCALEAKCYALNNGVGVKEMSRLISRIRYRQFGIMMTTSYVDSQAYEEVTQDGHPVLIAISLT